MALAVTHIILTIVILDLVRHYVFGKDKFTRYLLVIGGVAGLAPDIDMPFTWIYNWITGANANFHGTITHSLIFPLIFLIIGIFLQVRDNEKWSKIFYVISAGWFLHVILDCLFGGYKSFFWPVLTSCQFCPQWGIDQYAIGIDAIILVLWLVHEELHKQIRDYI